MKKIYLILILSALATSTCFAQREVLKIPLNYKGYFMNKVSFAIPNEKTGEMVLFIEDSDRTITLLVNSNFEITSEIETNKLPNYFRTFIGYQINDNQTYSVFFTNNNSKKYGILHLNFQEKKASINPLTFKLDRDELYLEGINFNGKFYLLSIQKKESDVYFYTFSEHGDPLNNNRVSFEFLNALSFNGYPKKAYDFLVSKGITGGGSLVEVDNQIPNAIEIAAVPNKLYTFGNKFIFTFDNDYLQTKVAIIDPLNFKLEVKQFSQDRSQKTIFDSYNSYLYNNKLFQVLASREVMVFTVKDFMTSDTLKKVVLKKDDPILFKNSAIIQEGTAFGNGTRELDETKQYLRKISQGKLGISAFYHNNNYHLTIGSYKETKGRAPMGGFGVMPVMAIGSLTMSFNPTYMAFGGYTTTKATYIDCLYNDKFDHVEGEIQNNVFDKIKNFEGEVAKMDSKEFSSNKNDRKGSGIYDRPSNTVNSPRLKNVFRFQNKVYYSFVGQQDRTLHLVEFSE